MTSFSDFKAAQPAMQAQEELIYHYVEVLVEALTLDAPENYTYTIDAARRFYKVWMNRYGKRDSIHVFVDKVTGDVLKPASTKAPAKGVRYRLLDEASREEMMSRADWAGSYLYIR